MDLNVLSFMNDVVLPIFIVVFLPVVIVLIVQIFRNRNLARKTDVIKLAIEKHWRVQENAGKGRWANPSIFWRK